MYRTWYNKDLGIYITIYNISSDWCVILENEKHTEVIKILGSQIKSSYIDSVMNSDIKK